MVFSWLLVIFMNDGPFFFLECVSLSLLLPLFTFDIIRYMCVCVCWISLVVFFLSVCLNVCREILLAYIYIYIYIFWQHFLVNTNFIKHNRYFMSTYFLLDPFEFPYYFYRIWGELIYVLSIVVCIPSTIYPTLGHHQGRIYYKSDVTFVFSYYYYVRASLPLKIMATTQQH